MPRSTLPLYLFCVLVTRQCLFHTSADHPNVARTKGKSVAGFRDILSTELFQRLSLVVVQAISDSRHDRFGLSSYCDMPVWGDVSQCVLPSTAALAAAFGDARGRAGDSGCRCITGDDDNDGLWTCVYAAGLAFKYAVTRQEQDRQRAWHRCVC
jgi:hypothetical protein